ncbi:MAG: AAA family ATPase [Opitutales bacterium]|nr:AAA family ATPase [Opitutales bacterium]
MTPPNLLLPNKPTPKNASAPAPSKDPFTPDCGPVCLRGFAGTEEATAVEWLKMRGFSVTRLLGSARVLLSGPTIERGTLGQATARGLRVVSWDDCRKGMIEATVVAPEPLSPPREPLPFAEATDAGRRVLNVELPERPLTDEALLGWVPLAERFAGVCFDQPFARTLQAVTTGVRHGLPVALEGETAASKTTAVLYLAHLLGQPVVRFNLNGQTDTGELVGRYVPAVGGAPVNNGSGVHPAPTWRFQEGSLPIALREGLWLLLDEMNLAEPQILERLNSVLEDTPTFVLTEHDNRRFGPGGDFGVHPAFHLFATMNPATYSGRSILSPAFRDRWAIWHHAGVPGEEEIHAMLLFQIFGEQPVVEIDGQPYRAEPVEPVFPEWQRVPEVRSWANRLAQFHAAVVKLAEPGGEGGGMGRRLRERPVFTRRGPLTLLRMVARDLGGGGAADARALILRHLRTVYLERLADRADRRGVESLLRASGLE